MKTKFFSVLAAAGLFFLASCGGGVSEETKKAVNSADSAMTAMMTDVETFTADVTKALDDCNACCASADSVGATVKPEWKGKCDSAMMDCKGAKASYEEILNKVNAAKAEWSADTTWASFKSKVEKGEIKDAEAKTELDAFNAKGATASGSVTEWKAAFTAANDKCKMGNDAWTAFQTWCSEQKPGKK